MTLQLKKYNFYKQPNNEEDHQRDRMTFNIATSLGIKQYLSLAWSCGFKETEIRKRILISTVNNLRVIIWKT